MSYGSVYHLGGSAGGNVLSLQIAADINHNSTSSTKQLWFRTSNNFGFQNDWKELLHSGNYNSYALPLSGGTLTGSLTVGSDGGGANYIQRAINGWGDVVQVWRGGSNVWNLQDSSGSAKVTSSSFYVGSNLALHAGNYSSYALPLSGGSLTGNLYINGSIALHYSNFSSYALPLSGGTLTGDVGVGSGFTGFNSISGTERTLYIANGNVASLYLHATGGSGRKYALFAGASGGLSIYDATGNATRFSLDTSSANFSVALQQSGNQVLHAGNYTSFDGHIRALGYPTSTNDWNALGNSYGNSVIQVDPSNFSSTSNGPTAASYTYGNLLNLSSNQNSQAQIYISHAGNDLIFRGGWGGGSWQTWNKVLTNQNYTSYSPSLTGSGASGTWGISITGNAATVGSRSPGTSAGNLAYYDSSSAYLITPSWIGIGGDKGIYAPSGMNGAHFYVNTDATYGTWRILGSRNGYTGISMDAVNGQMAFMASTNSNISGVHNQSYGWQYYWSGGVFYIARNTYGGNMATALHDANYSSYALPLSGGTVTGQATFSKTDDHAISVGTIRGRAVGGQSGEFLHIYERVHIGSPSGWGSRSAPSYGLSTYGGCALATDTGSVTIAGNTALHAGNYTSYSPSYSYFDDYQRGNYRVIADYGGFSTWYIRGDGRWVFARGHDWTVSFDLNLGSGTAGSNNGWAVLGQVTSNASNGTWRGVRFAQYVSGSQIDGDVRARRYYLGNDSDYLQNPGDGSMRLQNGNGYIDIGPKNSSWCHIYSDRTFYTNQDIYTNGYQQIHSGNYTSYAVPYSGGTLSGTWYFNTSSGGTSGALASPALQAYSTGNNAAWFSWHKAGHYAVNMGLDSDNVIRIGGWSAAANRWQLDMSGNGTYAGNVTAYSDERLKKDWSPIGAGFVDRLAGMLAGTYTRIDSNERQAGVSAQKMREILPEVVSEDNEGTLALAYGNAAMVSAVELAKELVMLKQELAEIKSRLH